jgi:hypothetical protein
MQGESRTCIDTKLVLSGDDPSYFRLYTQIYIYTYIYVYICIGGGSSSFFFYWNLSVEVLRCQYLYFCGSKASNTDQAPKSQRGGRWSFLHWFAAWCQTPAPAGLLRCQYLYFCTSKASNLSSKMSCTLVYSLTSLMRRLSTDDGMFSLHCSDRDVSPQDIRQRGLQT